jgi:hypothetical protein
MTGEYGAVVIATALTVRRVRWRDSTVHFAEVLAERDGMDPRHAGGSSATPPSP